MAVKKNGVKCPSQFLGTCYRCLFCTILQFKIHTNVISSNVKQEKTEDSLFRSLNEAVFVSFTVAILISLGDGDDGCYTDTNKDTSRPRATCNAWADDQRGGKQGDMSARSTASTVGQSYSDSITVLLIACLETLSIQLCPFNILTSKRSDD